MKLTDEDRLPADEIARNLEKRMGWVEGRITHIEVRRKGSRHVDFCIHCEPVCDEVDAAMLHEYLEQELLSFAEKVGVEAPKLIRN
jgi:hypothetical protein